MREPINVPPPPSMSFAALGLAFSLQRLARDGYVPRAQLLTASSDTEAETDAALKELRQHGMLDETATDGAPSYAVRGMGWVSA